MTFAPEAAGEFTGTLVLESNDPLNPLQEIVVRGIAVDPETSDSAGDGAGQRTPTRVVETEVGCGCGTTGTPAWPGMLALSAGGLALFRRRRGGRG